MKAYIVSLHFAGMVARKRHEYSLTPLVCFCNTNLYGGHNNYICPHVIPFHTCSKIRSTHYILLHAFCNMHIIVNISYVIYFVTHSEVGEA